MTDSISPFALLRILHLEDNPADAELVQSVLREEWPGCQVTRVETRDDFLAAVREGRADIILSDFSLPSYNGLRALEETRQHDSATPFIFLSGTIGEDYAVEALQRGATDYVIKDRPARLIPAIRRALETVREYRRRRRAEERLREIQEMFHQLAEKSSEIFWFAQFDPERILYVSPAFEAVWGRPASALYQSPRAWIDNVHPEDRARVANAYEACAAGRLPRFDEEYRVIRPDGTVRWVLDSGTPVRDAQGRLVRMSGIAKDVTERRVVEQHMREQADLLDKARDAIVVSDLDRRIVFWNKGAERMFGWPALEAVGRRSDELFGPTALHEIEGVKAGIASDEWNGEVRLHNKAGDALVLDSRVTVIRDAAGRPVSHLIISTDVTEQRKLEKQYLRAQRLESIGTLAGGIAHDLNNVLAPILMSISLLQRKTLDAEAQRLLTVLEHSAQHGAGLVQQVLAFARGTEGQRTELRVGAAVKQVIGLLAQTLPRAIIVQSDVAADVATISGDPTQFSQVLMNLCVNARDAMPNGGRLVIRAHNAVVTAAHVRAHPGAKPGPYVRVIVEDTGTGIPPEILDRIFDPFFTTKVAGKGTGLGLATVLGIVRGHAGFLEVQSTVGKGTAFTIYFPASPAVAPAAVLTAAPAVLPGLGRTVLLIEDEESVRAVTQALLEASDFRVLVAEDGLAGIGLYRNHRAEIHAVITDMMMPGMQGPEVIAELKQLNPEVRIVAMSGVVGERAGLTEQPGRLAFLQKPMTGEDLLRALIAVLPATV
ncbi:MAG TPA: response regulator [Opitutaceae bacterium]|nr:response regulator [Opitutaceae bacterium]